MASLLDRVKSSQRDDLNTKDELGRTALSRAVIDGDLDRVEYLLIQGSDINVLDIKNMSPVQHAVESSEWHVVRYLVDQGADVNVPDKEGVTVLQRAITAGKWDVVKHMIAMGADVNVLDRERVSPVQYAVEASEWDVAKCMVEKGGKLDGLTSKQKDNLLEEVIGQATDTDQSFYNVVRLGSYELLEMLILKKGFGNDSNNPDIALKKLDRILAKTYEELKIRNVPLSPELQIQIEKKLISLRFFTKRNGRSEEFVKVSLSDVKKRVEMVCGQVGEITRRYSGAKGKEVDGEFLLASRFVAQNIRILKRLLKSTYCKLPWEEMEFCLSIYISFYTPGKVNDLYKLVLDKERLLTHLGYFSKKLNEVNINLRDEDVNSQFPQRIDTNPPASIDANKSVIDPPASNEANKSEIDPPSSNDANKSEIDPPASNDANKSVIDMPASNDANKSVIDMPARRNDANKSAIDPPASNDANKSVIDTPASNDANKSVIDPPASNDDNKSVIGPPASNDANKSVIDMPASNDANKSVIDPPASNDGNKSVIDPPASNDANKSVIDSPASNDDNKSVIDSNTLFKDLYNDHALIKNLYSLNRIESYIKLALSLNLDEENKKDTGRLVIERTLQVIGESLKNSRESPNVSDDIHEMLLHYAPKNVKEIITSLRDSISHAHAIKTKILLEDNDDPRFFQQVQNDLRKIHLEITHILYQKNLDVIATFFNKIIESKNPFEVNKLCNRLYGLELLEEIKVGDKTKEFKKTKELVQELITEFKDQIGFELAKEYLNIVKNSVYTEERRLADVKRRFTSAVKALAITIGQVTSNQDMVSNLDSIKNMVHTFLELLKQPIKTEARKEMLEYARYIQYEINRNMCEHKITKQKSDKIQELLHYITCNVDFEASRVKDIHTFKKRLEKKENVPQSEALERMKSILDEIEKNIKAEHTRKNLKKTLQTGEKIHRMKKNLVTFFVDSNDGSGYSNEKIVQKYNDLVNVLEITPKKKEVLMKKFQKADLNKRKEIIGNFEDKFQILLNSVTNSLNFKKKKSSVLCESFKRFFSSSKELNEVIDNTLTTNKNQFQSYYEKRLEKLNKLFSTNSGSVDDVLELVSTYENNKEFQSALDMLVLDLTDILDQSSLFGDNKLYLDGYSPVLVGKQLRNYLAHGDALIDTLPYNPSTAIISNAILLLKANKDLVTQKSVLVGQRIEEPLENLIEHYNLNLGLITRQNEMFIAAKEGIIEKVKSCIDEGVDINSRDLKGCTGMHYAAQSDNIEVVKYFLDQNLIINMYDINGLNVLHVAGKYGSDNVIKYLINENKVNVNSISGAKKTLLHYVASSGADMQTVTVLLDKGALVDARDNDDRTPLHVSALGGREDVTLALLENGATVHACDDQGATPLHLASFQGHQNVAQVLLQKNALVNAVDENLRMPLHMAAWNGHKDVAVMLVVYEAAVNACDDGDYTPLHGAAYGGKLDVVEMLLMFSDTKINDGNSIDNSTPLHMAVRFGQKEVTLMLLKYGANVNALNKDRDSPLHLAVRSGHQDIVLTLLEQQYNVDPLNNDHLRTEHHDNIANKEISIDILNNDNNSPLHLAADLGHQDMVMALLKKGAKIEARNLYGMTPLNIAALKAHHGVVKILLKNKATVHTKNKLWHTPLYSAAISGNRDIVLALLKEGSKVIEADINSNSPLHAAAEKGHKEVVIMLLDNGADVNVKGLSSNRPLHLAVKNGHKEIVEELLSRNADIEAVVIDGETALHGTALFGQYEVACVLLKYKAKVDATMKDEMTPLCLAALYGYPELAQLLLNNKADVNTLVKESRMPLHLAAQNGHRDVTMVLLDNHAKVEALDAKEFRPLHLAAQEGHIEVVEALLDIGAEVNAANLNHDTPLHLATFHGHKDVVQLLLKNKAVVNAADMNCVTPLHHAAFLGLKDICVILLDNGANFLARDFHCYVLHRAVSGNNSEVLKLVLDKIKEKYINDAKNWYDSINAQDTDSDTPLMLAAEGGKVDAAEILLEYGANKDAQNKDGKTALHWATVNDHMEIVEILIVNKANANVKDKDAKTPYDLAREKNALLTTGNEKNEIIKALLQSVTEENSPSLEHLSEQEKQVHGSLNTIDDFLETGGDVRTADNGDMTPLMAAAKTGNIDATKKLIEQGADIDAQNNEGRTALHYATEMDNLEIVEILIDNKADANKKDQDGKTSYDLAREKYAYLTTDNEKNEIIKALLQSVTEEYCPSLEHLSEQEKQVHGFLNTIDDFLETGGDVRTADNGDMTPLMAAAKTGNVDATKKLIEQGADIDAQNNEGRTALHYATEMDNLEIVEILIDNKADANKKDQDGKTSYDLAREKYAYLTTDNEKNEIIKALLQSVTEENRLH